MKKLLSLAIVALTIVACTPHAPQDTPPTFLNLARTRYAVRQYDTRPVEQAKIDSILLAARIAPTARNLQPQHIYILQSDSAISTINALTRCAYGAPLVFLVCYDTDIVWSNGSTNTGDMDASIVGTHMMLEATEQGLGTCWVKYFDPAEVAAAFHLPANHVPSFLLPCGYPAAESTPSPMHFEKKEIKEFVTYK